MHAGRPTDHACDCNLSAAAPPRRTATPLRVVGVPCRRGPRAQPMQWPRHEDRRGAARRTDCMRHSPDTPSSYGTHRIGGGGREGGGTRGCPHGSPSSEAARARRVRDPPRAYADPARRIPGCRVTPSPSGGRRPGRRGPCPRRACACPGSRRPYAVCVLEPEPVTMTTQTHSLSRADDRRRTTPIKGARPEWPLPSPLPGQPTHRRTR